MCIHATQNTVATTGENLPPPARVFVIRPSALAGCCFFSTSCIGLPRKDDSFTLLPILPPGTFFSCVWGGGVQAAALRPASNFRGETLGVRLGPLDSASGPRGHAASSSKPMALSPPPSPRPSLCTGACGPTPGAGRPPRAHLTIRKPPPSLLRSAIHKDAYFLSSRCFAPTSTNK